MGLASGLGWFMVEDTVVILAPLPKLTDAEFDALDALLGDEWSGGLRTATAKTKQAVATSVGR